jgi:hypothetical protein
MSITDQFWQYAKEAILSAPYAKTDEDRQGVCIKLLTAAENDPALARLVRSKSSNHSSPLTHSSQSCHGFSGNPKAPSRSSCITRATLT